MKRSKKARQRGRLVAQLDAEAREACFERDGYTCQRCFNKKRAVQWAHMISRRHKHTRWLLVNCLTLCAGCHMWYDGYPLLSGEWFRKNWPDRYEELMRAFNGPSKVSVADLRERLAETK